MVYVPMLEQEYNVFIPIVKNVGIIKKTIVDVISDITGYQLKNDMKLVDRNTNKVYDERMFVTEAEIQNGTKLLLV